MPYTPQTWSDGSAGGTPLSAARLTAMENGIRDAYLVVSPFSESVNFTSMPANTSTVFDHVATTKTFPAGTRLLLLGVDAGGPVNGLVIRLTGVAPAANTVRFIVQNHTGGAIDPVAVGINLATIIP